MRSPFILFVKCEGTRPVESRTRRTNRRPATAEQPGNWRLPSRPIRPKWSHPSLAPLGREDDPTARSFGPWNWLFAAALVVAVFLVYQPAWQGGFVWDDDDHLTRPELRSWHGLYRIWFDIRATQQYYPLSYSAFWVEHKLWGDATLGYHLVNISLHATAALLVALILRRLAVPGAYLAAAIFALHPVQVESVAWITELKNTLSGVFYLGAMLALPPLRPDAEGAVVSGGVGLVRAGPAEQDRHRDAAGGAAGDLLVAAGTVVVETRRAAAGAVFLVGAVAGMLTVWVERT